MKILIENMEGLIIFQLEKNFIKLTKQEIIMLKQSLKEALNKREYCFLYCNNKYFKKDMMSV